MIKLYKSKIVIKEAIQFTGKLRGDTTICNFDEILTFCGDKAYIDIGGLYIRTLEGDHHVSFDDYVIKGLKGEFYPCKPDVFELTYEEVENGRD